MEDSGQEQSPSFDLFDKDDQNLVQANDKLVRARNDIASLLVEIEDITLHENPRIAAEWQVAIGAWENKLLEAQINARRAKRKCNLIQANVNAGLEVDEKRIENQLDNEFEQWREQLNTAIAEYQEALEAQVTTIYISPNHAGSLKKLFRTLAKRLHPDLHPGQDENTKRMFLLAEAAYKRCDVKILESLEVSTRHLEADQSLPATAIEAEAELTLLMAQETMLRERLQQVKSERPYCLRELLANEEWMENRIEEIKGEIASCEETQRLYQARCEEMVNGHE